MKEDRKEIPFLKAVRVGNFKLWRGKYVVGKGNDKMTIDCIHLSTLDGTWMVRIPSTWEMYGQVMFSYNDTFSDNAETKASAEMFLSTVCSNMLYASCIGNGHYHQAISMLTTIYADPTMVGDKKKLKTLKKDAENLIKSFLAWRKEYDKIVAKSEPTEEEMHQDDLAEEAIDILNEEGPSK